MTEDQLDCGFSVCEMLSVIVVSAADWKAGLDQKLSISLGLTNSLFP